MTETYKKAREWLQQRIEWLQTVNNELCFEAANHPDRAKVLIETTDWEEIRFLQSLFF